MKLEIKRVPGTKSAPYHYQLYVDDVLVYTRKTQRLYNAGAVRFAALGSGDKLTHRWLIEAMRKNPHQFDYWMARQCTIVPVTHPGLKTFIVQATCVVAKGALDHDDKLDFNWITEPYEVEAENEDAALDSYHGNIPIACLDDFDIDVKIK